MAQLRLDIDIGLLSGADERAGSGCGLQAAHTQACLAHCHPAAMLAPCNLPATMFCSQIQESYPLPKSMNDLLQFRCGCGLDGRVGPEGGVAAVLSWLSELPLPHLRLRIGSGAVTLQLCGITLKPCPIPAAAA